MNQTHCPHCGRALDENMDAVIDRATALLASGMTGTAAAQELGIPMWRLCALMAKAGTPVKSFKLYPGLRPGSSDPDRTRQMLDLRRAGWSYPKIAARFDISADRARCIVVAHQQP